MQNFCSAEQAKMFLFPPPHRMQIKILRKVLMNLEQKQMCTQDRKQRWKIKCAFCLYASLFVACNRRRFQNALAQRKHKKKKKTFSGAL